MTDCVCSIDLGTTWIKGGVFDLEGRALFQARAPAPPCTAWNGFTTFEPEAYVDRAFAVLRELMEQVVAAATPHRILAIAPVCQRASVVGLGAGNHPCTPFVCWHDTSAEDAAASFVRSFPIARYRAITGMPPSFLLSLFKILALRTRAPAEAGAVHRFALLQDIFLMRLGAERICCDPSNAAATGLYDLRAGGWSDELLALADLSPDRLPEVLPAGTPVGRLSQEASRRSQLPAGIALFVGAGDQPSSTLAAGALGPDRVSVCLGTAGIFNQPVTVPDMAADDPWYYLPHAVPGLFVREGIVPSVGSSFEWIVRAMGLPDAGALDAEARSSPPGANGLRFLPFLGGIGTPEYAGSVAGSFQEIRATHTRADLIRAVLEGVALETRRVLDVLDPSQVSEIVVSGNACRSEVFTETLAALTGGRLFIPDQLDLALRGGALIAATGVGRFAALAEAGAHTGGQAHAVGPPEGRDRIEAAFSDYGARVASALRGSDAGLTLVESLGFPRSTRRKVDEMIRKSLKLGRVAFYCYRLDGTVTYMDRAALRIIDLEERYPDPAAVVGANMRDLIVYVQPEGKVRQRILTTGEVTQFEYHFRTLSGQDRWTLHDSFLDSDPDTGEPIIHAMVQDITEKKLAALEIERSRMRLRELAQRLVNVRQQERAQLADALHDGIAQTLFALRLQLQALARPDIGRSDLADRASLIDAELGQALARVGCMIETLRPGVLRELGLVAAMRHELRKVATDTAFDVSLRVDGGEQVSPDAALVAALFRIFQEAVANAVRHSGGSRIEASLAVAPDAIELVVADDGAGLPKEAALRPKTFGLLGIEECALTLNGRSWFEPNVPHGTIIRVRVPRSVSPESG